MVVFVRSDFAALDPFCHNLEPMFPSMALSSSVSKRLLFLPASKERLSSVLYRKNENQTLSKFKRNLTEQI